MVIDATVGARFIAALQFFIRLQRVQSLLHELSPQLLFFRRWQLGVPGDVHDAGSKHDAVGTDHLGNRLGRGNLYHRDAGFF
jgi:hypothetical protein